MTSVIDKETFIECESWSHAEQNSSGYSCQDTIDFYEKLNTTSKDTKRNEFLSPRHTELFCAIQRSINDEDSISVADIGGGNGYLGFDAIKFFGDSLNWTVFETQGFADIYNSLQQGKVSFERIDQYLPNRKFSISLFSCSLQYMKNCYEMLQRSLGNSSYVILSRLPVLDCRQDKTTIQNVSLDGKNVSWPAYLFGETLIEFITSKATIIYRWQTPSEQILFQNEIISLQGMLLKPK